MFRQCEQSKYHLLQCCSYSDLRYRAEVALRAAKNLAAEGDFRKIRLQLVACWAAYDECRQYKKELEVRTVLLRSFCTQVFGYDVETERGC